MTSPSWENREKFAASRLDREHMTKAWLYEPLADLFFLYFNIRPINNKTKINNQTKKKKKKKNAARIFFSQKTRAVVGQRSSPAGYILYCNILSLSHII